MKLIKEEKRRTPLIESLPEFELTQIEKLEWELRASEQIRAKLETDNLDLCKRIRSLEFELEKQIEYNKELKNKQSSYKEEVLMSLSSKISQENENAKVESDSDFSSPWDSRRELYDENMISMKFNQSLVKYESGQSLHSPYFEEWDEKIDNIQEVFSRWIIHLERIVESSGVSSKTLTELQKVFMEDLTAFDFSTEVVNDLYSFADMIKELASMQEALYESLQSLFIEYIKEFNKNFVMKVKENKKIYNKQFDDYYNLISKKINIKKEAALEDLNSKIDDSKKELELAHVNYVDSLNEIIIHTKVDLIDKVCVCIYCFGSFFKQGSSLFDKLAPQLHSSTKRVAARSNIIRHLKMQLDSEKEKCKKDGENKDKPNLRLIEKEGFVFKQNSIKEWLLRYLIVRDETLFTVKRIKNTGRYDYNNATMFCNIFLAKIRKSNDYPDLPIFEIVSVKDNKTFVLMVENMKEMEEWIQVLNLKVQRQIENPKILSAQLNKYHSVDAKQLSSKPMYLDRNTEIINYDHAEETSETDKRLNEEVKKIINENICADWKTPFPEWFSINLGVLIWITCSGYHRGLSTDVSRVKSLTLDTHKITTLMFLKSVINNDINRKVFEAKTSSVEKARK